MEQYITFEDDIDRVLTSLEGETANGDITKATTSANTSMIELIDNIIRTGMEKRSVHS